MTRRTATTDRTERQHQLRVWMPRSEYMRLRDAASARGETISIFVRRLIAAEKSSLLRRTVSRMPHVHKK
jgi:hypothetical protein